MKPLQTACLGLSLLTVLVCATAATKPPASHAGMIWEGTNSAAHVIWRKDNLIIEAETPTPHKTYDWRADNLAEVKDDWEKDDTLSKQLTVQSMVGPWVSVKEAVYWMSPTAAHPGMVTRFRVVDADHPTHSVLLTDWFTDADILKALLADPFIAGYLPKDHPRFKTTDELLSWLNENIADCDVYFAKDMLSHFAFYQRQGDKVAVRLGLSHGCEAARGHFTEVGIWLPLTPQARPWFDQAGNITMSQLVPKTSQAQAEFDFGPQE